MNKKFQTIIAALILVGLTTAGLWSAAAQEPAVGQTAGEFKAGELLVKFKAGVSASATHSTLNQYNATLIRSLYLSDVQLWQVPEGRELALMEQLNADPVVEYAEPNHVYHAFDTDVTPNDLDTSKQWAHSKMNSTAAWDITTGSTGVTIAIIDTGIDESHPDLSGKIVAGYDYVDNDSNPHDTNGHGTHCAGIAAASTNNGTGIAGTDWNARIMPIRVLNSQGSGYSSDIIDGITWAYSHGADVLSLSLGGPDYSPSMQNAINAAHADGSLIVAAMGNCRTAGSGCSVANPTSYPAAYNNVMAVASTGPSDIYAPYSQHGSHCDIAAPGGDMSYYHDPAGIYSTMPTYDVYMTTNHSYSKNYDYVNGTSQATPYVAGLAGLVWAAAPSLTPDEVQSIIEDTAVDLGSAGWDSTYGHGRIDALAALQAIKPPAPTLNTISNSDLDGNYLVNWNAVSGASSYTLQEDDNSSFTSPTTLYTGSDTQHSVSGQSAGVWYYRVGDYNGTAYSDWSNTESAGVVPAAPVLNAITTGSTSDEYLVDWEPAFGATGYTLQEDDDALFNSPTTRYMGTATQYNVTGQPGGTWYHRVRAYNSVGDSSRSNTMSTTVDTPALGAPTLSPIGNADGNGNYGIDWTDVPTATTYKLEESSDAYFSSLTVVYSGTATQTQVLDQAGGTWYYRVRAFGTTSEIYGPWSESKPAVVTTYIYLPVLMRNYGTTLGFNSQFNGSTTGWEAHSGAWTVDSDHYSTSGLSNSFSSASYTADFTNFDYQVKLRRSGCDACANQIMIRGTPTPLSGNSWYSYYSFHYSQMGAYSIWNRVGGSSLVRLKGWTYSSTINQGDAWNTLRIVANGANISFYINGTLVWAKSDFSLLTGRVGVGMYRSDTSTGDLLRVDWATLSTSNAAVADPDEASAEQPAPHETGNQPGSESENVAP